MTDRGHAEQSGAACCEGGQIPRCARNDDGSQNDGGQRRKSRTRAWKWAAAGKRLWAGLALGLGLVLVGLTGADRWLYEHVSRVLNTEDNFYDRDFYTVTLPFWTLCRWLLASIPGAATLLCVIVALRPARWRRAVAGLAVIVVVALAANLLQAAVGRVRPNRADTHLAFTHSAEALLQKQGVSFPSGEAAAAFALACVLAGLLPRLRYAAFGAAGVAAAARLVNGAHYLSDVAAGALFGWLAARAALGPALRLVDAAAAALARRSGGRAGDA